MPNAAFTALLDDVYTLTNRSDLVAETTMAVRAATLKCHQSDFYPRDLVESRVQFEASANFQALAYRSLFPGFRALSYARKYEDGAATCTLQPIEPSDIFDNYNVAKENVWYLAGEVIQIRSSTAFTDLLIGFYNNPVTLPDTYSSWVADMHPFAIVFEAASQVLRAIGNLEDANSYANMARDQLMQLRNSNILAEGY